MGIFLDSTIEIIVWAVSAILYIVGFFFGKLLIIAGYILNWVLTLNSNILDNPAVQIGWQITRDLSNLGFVFLIILIAFGTILRMGSFQIKSMLPKLIVAALLINFSLLIAAVFLDFAGVLMNYFFNHAYTSSGGDGGIGMALTGAMSVHGFMDTPTMDNAAFAAFSVASLNYIASLIFLNIATIIGAITLLAMAFMFLVRYIIIGFLLIMLPAAILAWVAGGKGWSDWSGKFFQYTFFGPLAGFYIYIALKTSQAITSLPGSQLSQVITEDPSGLISNMASHLGSLIIMVAMLLYGLSLAEKQCEIGGKNAVAMADGAIKGMLKGGVSSGFKSIGGEGLVKKAAEWQKNSKNPFLRGLTRPIRQIADQPKEGLKKYPGIMSGLSEGIAEGWGGESRKFRMDEEGKYKARDAKIGALSSKLAASTGLSLEDATSDVEKEIDKNMKINPETALEEAGKNIIKRMDTTSAFRDLSSEFSATELKAVGVTDEKSFEAVITNNQGNVTEAKNEIRLKAGKTKKFEALDNEKKTSEANKQKATTNMTSYQTKLNQLQLDLNNATKNIANLNPQQLQQLTDKIKQDIAKTEQDVKDEKQIIDEETKNIAQTQKAIKLL